VIHLIQLAMQNPVQPIIEEDSEAKEVSRQICSTNQIHQADQIMRKLISQEMFLVKGTRCTCILKYYRDSNILERMNVSLPVVCIMHFLLAYFNTVY